MPEHSFELEKKNILPRAAQHSVNMNSCWGCGPATTEHQSLNSQTPAVMMLYILSKTTKLILA